MSEKVNIKIVLNILVIWIIFVIVLFIGVWMLY